MTWRRRPDLAAAGRRLLFHPGFGFGHLATVAADGSPRLHPVNPLIRVGRLLVFVMPSPKLADLKRNGLYALHSSQTETVDDEFLIIGKAEVLESPELRKSALADNPLSVGDDHDLVELTIRRVLWVHYWSPGTRYVTSWTSST